MHHEKFPSLNWKHIHSNNLTSNKPDKFKENSFSDVTLVSDDKIPYQAHKYVLSAFSPVLKNILLDNPHSHQLIYLRGINHLDLESILQFLYLGKVSIYAKNMDRFTQAATDLQIKPLVDEIEIGQQNNVDMNEDQNKIRSINEEIVCLEVPVSEELAPDMQMYRCEECGASYKSKRGLNHHISGKHKGVVYFCKYCGYRTTQQGTLKTHQNSLHEGLRYPCTKCDYQARERGNLRKHQKYVHEGVKYYCKQCDYHATTQGHLTNHRRSVHEGVKYSCNQCEYKTARKYNLKCHIYKKH